MAPEATMSVIPNQGDGKITVKKSKRDKKFKR